MRRSHPSLFSAVLRDDSLEARTCQLPVAREQARGVEFGIVGRARSLQTHIILFACVQLALELLHTRALLVQLTLFGPHMLLVKRLLLSKHTI